MTRCFWVTVILALCVHSGTAARLQAAKVLSVRGVVWVQEPQKQARKLGVTSVGSTLHAGDKVKPEANSSIVLEHRNGERETISARNTWILVRRRPTANELRIRSEIQSVAATAAKPRNLHRSVLFPAAEEVSASGFVIIVSSVPNDSIRAAVYDESGYRIFEGELQRSGVVASSASLRSQLRAAQAAQISARFDLELSIGGESAAFPFLLMSDEKERALKTALEAANSDDIGSAHLQRSLVYLEHGLPSLAAIELYELTRLDPHDGDSLTRLRILIGKNRFPELPGLKGIDTGDGS